MSDDPTPPLRMKPRLSVSSEENSLSSSPDPSETPADAASASTPDRLPPNPAAPPPAPFVSPFLSEPAAVPAPATPTAHEARPTLPLPPASASAPAPKKTTIHIRAPKTRTDDSLVPGKSPAPAKPLEKKMVPAARLALAAGLLVVLAAAALVAYRFYFATPPSASSPAKTLPTPSATLNAVAAAPGNAVSEVQAAVDARRTENQARVDALITGETPPPAQAARPKPPAKPAPTITTDVSLAPGIVMSVPDDNPGATTASPAFRSFVADAKIGGVRANATPPSALINNRLVRLGQPVDNGLGLSITLSAANAETRELTFKDSSGAIVTRRY